MGRRSRGCAGDFAAVEVPDHAEPAIDIDAKRSARTLAVHTRSALAWIGPDEIPLTGNLHATSLLSLRVGRREQNEAEHNNQFTHHSLQSRLPHRGGTITMIGLWEHQRKACLFAFFPKVNSVSYSK